MRRIIFLGWLLVFSTTAIVAQDKSTKATNRKFERKVAQADRLIRDVWDYIDAFKPNSRKADRKIDRAYEIIKSLEKEHSKEKELGRLKADFYYRKWGVSFMQKNKNVFNILPDAWFEDCIKYDRAANIITVLVYVYTIESYSSVDAYQYWKCAKDAFVAKGKDSEYIEVVNDLYVFLGKEAEQEYGLHSIQEASVLAEQLEYNKQIKNTALVEQLETQVAPFRDEIKTNGKMLPGKGQTFIIIEQMPRFPGCEELEGDNKSKKKCSDEKLMKFIKENLRYPPLAKANQLEGRVVVQFIVSEEGHIDQIKLLRDVGMGLGEEAIRLVQLMNEMPERWTPGEQRGKKVKVRMYLPVIFKLN
jgi:TonB family protein